MLEKVNPWFTLDQYRKVFHFLGKRLLGMLLLGGVVGFCLYSIELGIASFLYYFLVVLGLASKSSASVFAGWLPFTLENVLILLVGLASAKGVLRWFEITLNASVGDTFIYHQRMRLVNWAFNRDSVSASDMVTLFSERVVQSSHFIKSFQAAVISGTYVLFIAGTLFVISVQISTILSIFILVVGIPLYYISAKINLAGKEVFLQAKQINKRVIRGIRNLILLRVYALARRENNLAMENLKVQLASSVRAAKLSASVIVALEVIGILAICFATMYAHQKDAMSSVKLVAYFYLFIRLLQNGIPCVRHITACAMRWPQISALANWWAKHGSDLPSVQPVKVKEIIDLNLNEPIQWNVRNITFTYADSVKPTIYQFSHTFEAGRLTAIIGPSGSGKSTLLRLLLGQLKPQGGELLLRSHPWSGELEVAKESILRRVGYVGAESYFVEGSLYENLVYGLETEPTKDELRRALEMTYCNFIAVDSLKRTFLTEQGLGLSAGQRQRLELARALLRKPLALFLDEATSNVDYETEAAIVEGLKELEGKVTIIAATHKGGILGIADAVIDLGETVL